ncbi:hypothetical protein ATANTOWER_001324 [Ataeniobius toweri]|uniref:Uncharacterized protein n=1 Tax=Ataeniobius toweri TaxID=208326 RepID=A0ABU7B6M5_9TELE|nr:hypothetical protein [Ataeniobius toweri]
MPGSLQISLYNTNFSGLFTTTSCNLKRHIYCAPGMPAAMQQSNERGERGGAGTGGQTARKWRLIRQEG